MSEIYLLTHVGKYAIKKGELFARIFVLIYVIQENVNPVISKDLF
jgi:hypothetical protein